MKKKKRLKKGFFFKWDRSKKFFVKLSPMGSYYYWFARINKVNYYISFYKFYFKSILKSYYIINIIILYILLLFLILKIKNNYIIYNYFNFKQVNGIASIIKYIKE